MSEKRKVVSVKISAEAARGIYTFCANNGVSVTAFFEVVGQTLTHETHPPAVPERRRMVEEARRVDSDRRSRRP